MGMGIRMEIKAELEGRWDGGNIPGSRNSRCKSPGACDLDIFQEKRRGLA